MQKNKLSLHLTLFFILLGSTAFFVYQSFYVEKSSDKQVEINNNNSVTNNDIETNNKVTTTEDKIIPNKEKTEIKPTTKEQHTSTLVQETVITSIQATTEEHKQLPYSATITVNQKNYTVDFEKEGTILKDLLNKLQTESDFTFFGINYSGLGFFITEINGIKNDNKQGKYWVYYLNGVSAKAGISIQKINSQDNIEWKYENSTF